MVSRSWAHDGMNNVQARMNSYMDTWLLSSSDAGQTWSRPRNISAQLWSAAQHMPALSNGHGIQTSTGRLIVPACARPHGGTPRGHMQVYPYPLGVPIPPGCTHTPWV